MKKSILLILIICLPIICAQDKAPEILPDSPYYKFKVFGEKFQEFITIGDHNRAELKNKHAERRISELQAIITNRLDNINNKKFDTCEILDIDHKLKEVSCSSGICINGLCCPTGGCYASIFNDKDKTIIKRLIQSYIDLQSENILLVQITNKYDSQKELADKSMHHGDMLEDIALIFSLFENELGVAINLSKTLHQVSLRSAIKSDNDKGSELNIEHLNDQFIKIQDKSKSVEESCQNRYDFAWQINTSLLDNERLCTLKVQYFENLNRDYISQLDNFQQDINRAQDTNDVKEELSLLTFNQLNKLILIKEEASFTKKTIEKSKKSLRHYHETSLGLIGRDDPLKAAQLNFKFAEKQLEIMNVKDASPSYIKEAAEEYKRRFDDSIEFLSKSQQDSGYRDLHNEILKKAPIHVELLIDIYIKTPSAEQKHVGLALSGPLGGVNFTTGKVEIPSTIYIPPVAEIESEYIYLDENNSECQDCATK